MSAKPEVPDAWDADWESQADVSTNISSESVSEEQALLGLVREIIRYISESILPLY
jgi:hypothetical protein